MTERDDRNEADSPGDPDASQPPLDRVSEEERRELAAIMASNRGSLNSLSLAEADGFFAALIAGPSAPPDEIWMDMVFGETPQLTVRERQKCENILFHRFDDICDDLWNPLEFQPWLDLDAEGKPDPAGWIRGFLQAMVFAPEWWERLMETKDGRTFVLPLFALADPTDLEDPADDAPKISDESRAALANLRATLGPDVQADLRRCLSGILTHMSDDAEEQFNASRRTTSRKKKRVKHRRPRRRK